jgi:hypothetical protein
MSAAAIVHPKLAQACFEKEVRPLLTDPVKFEALGINLLKASFPTLDVELDWHLYGSRIRLRIDGTDFPYRPVSGWWIDSDGARLLPGRQQVPAGNGFHTSGLDGQPACWFCFKGWREYHDHQSHQDVSWAALRSDRRYSVLQLLMQLRTDLNATGVNKQ